MTEKIIADVSNKEIQTLEKLEKLLENHKLSEFDDDDYVALKKVINIVKGFEALGTFAGFVRKTIMYFALFIGTIIAIKNNMVSFIINVVQGTN